MCESAGSGRAPVARHDIQTQAVPSSLFTGFVIWAEFLTQGISCRHPAVDQGRLLREIVMSPKRQGAMPAPLQLIRSRPWSRSIPSRDTKKSRLALKSRWLAQCGSPAVFERTGGNHRLRTRQQTVVARRRRRSAVRISGDGAVAGVF